jgi:hypothetical protein
VSRSVTTTFAPPAAAASTEKTTGSFPYTVLGRAAQLVAVGGGAARGVDVADGRDGEAGLVATATGAATSAGREQAGRSHRANKNSARATTTG